MLRSSMNYQAIKNEDPEVFAALTGEAKRQKARAWS